MDVEFVADPIEIFKRDGWKCMKCGIRTPRKQRGTLASNAPELDHIKPLGMGGNGSPANCQCLCRACNQAKGMTYNGQLVLST
jgi:5-methylcytosine-specific restriction endonuclease McrA